MTSLPGMIMVTLVIFMTREMTEVLIWSHWPLQLESSLVRSRGEVREVIGSTKRIPRPLQALEKVALEGTGQQPQEVAASQEMGSSVFTLQGAALHCGRGACWQILPQRLQIGFQSGWHLDFFVEDPASCVRPPNPQVRLDECCISGWVCETWDTTTENESRIQSFVSGFCS